MNLLMIYNLFLAGVERTIQSLGSIEVGRGDNEAFRLILRKSFRFITVSMLIPVLWIVAHYAPSLLWYSYLIAYVIELPDKDNKKPA